MGVTGTGKGRDRIMWVGQRGEEGENFMLLGYVQDYWGFYAGEVDDRVCGL